MILEGESERIYQLFDFGGSKVEEKDIANFLFEAGTMRKILRMHRQALLTDDMSDNISTHSFRVVIIGYFLAKIKYGHIDFGFIIRQAYAYKLVYK